MKQNEAKNIKIGNQIKITQDKNYLCDYGIPQEDAGKTVTVIRLDPGNDQVVYNSPSKGCEYYITSKGIAEIVSKKSGKIKFNQKQVEDLRRIGGNDRVKAEITTRVNTVINTARNVLIEDKAQEAIKLLDTTIREIKLLRKNIQN